MSERVALGPSGQDYVTQSLEGLRGFASFLAGQPMSGEYYTYLPERVRPTDLGAGGLMQQSVGLNFLRDEILKTAAPGDILLLQDAWGQVDDYDDLRAERTVVFDGGIHFWDEALPVEIASLEKLLRRSTSFLWLVFLVDGKERGAFQEAHLDRSFARSNIKFLAVSAFDQEGFVFWRP